MTQDQAFVARPGAASSAWRPSREMKRRALILAGLLLAGWCLTGVTAIRYDQRAVYERFGASVAVLHPGLHLVLPWPFSHLRRVDLGTVREVAVPAGWRLLYRVGSTDAQAMDAAYGGADPDALVVALGSQVAASHPAVAGSADQAALLAGIQAALDRDYSGLDVVAAVLATGEPTATDLVPAADIEAQTILTQARSAAAVERVEARQRAAAQVAAARAKASETVAAARSGLVEFTADRAADKADGKSFLLERYLADLSRAIGHSPKTIIDHRLNWPAAPELDLRPPPGVAQGHAAAGGKGN